ncbi:MAG TPA: Uma2 family endonuclease [Chloroflexia bacterium]|nr:Uma2 family endonuclease [Chloroflexia bacterium]
MTIEEFSRLPDSEHKELVRGEVIESMPPSKEHGRIAFVIGILLHRWVERGAGGQIGVESGFILARDPGIVRAPDVHYVSDARIAADNEASAFWTIAPDLAVEVVSPSETAQEVRDKVREFLAAGTPLVWTVYPRTGEVIVHTADGLARTYSADDILEHPDVLPGFSCKVAELFE